MRTYEYAAAAPSGTRIRGRAWAADELELDRVLESKGLVLVGARVALREGRAKRLRLRRDELARIVGQLAATTSAGVPLAQGLDAIGRRLSTVGARSIAAEMVAGLERGESLSAVLERHPRAFPRVAVSAVRAGEASGELASVLQRLARHLEWTGTLRAAALQALFYPAVLACAVTGLLLVLLGFVLPRITRFYPGGRADLPVETRAVLAASEALAANAVWLACACAALGLAARIAWTRPGVRERVHAALLAIPRFGRLLGALATARFAATASTLQAAGCDALTVLSIAGEACGNAALGASFQRTSASVRRGSTIAHALEREPLVDPLLVQMVGVGERTGELGPALARVAEHYDAEVPRSVRGFAAVLEPALLVGAGLVVAFVLLAALLPLFDVYGSFS